MPDRIASSQSLTGALTEVIGYCQLGDFSTAESLFQWLPEEVAQSENALFLRAKIARAQGDFEKSVSFAMQCPSPSDELNRMDVAHSLGSYAGKHRDAYELALSQEEDCGHLVLYWFNRACYASLCGEFEDAVPSLARCLELQCHSTADAFLDPDLQPLWDFLDKTQMNLRCAEYFLDRRWRQATRYWASHGAPYVVPVKCWENIPSHLQKFIPKSEAAGAGGLLPSPQMPNHLYNEYLDWQWAEGRKNVEALLGFLSRAEDFLMEYQAAFALEQARAGNFTAARYHYLRHLEHFPDKPLPDTMLRDAGLGYLVDDVRGAREEDALFIRKMSQLHDLIGLPAGQIHDAWDDIVDSVGPVGKTTCLFAMRQAGVHAYLGNPMLSLAHIRPVMEKWPNDVTPFFIGIEAAASLEEWELANELYKMAPRYYGVYRVNQTHADWIENRAKTHSRPQLSLFLGQRDMGGCLLPEAAMAAGSLEPAELWRQVHSMQAIQHPSC